MEKFFSPTVSFITAQRTKIEESFSTFNENQELKQSIASLRIFLKTMRLLRLE